MTPAEIIARVRETGAAFQLIGGRLALVGRSLVSDELAVLARERVRDIRAVLSEEDANTAGDAVVAAARLLRDGRWPATTPEKCPFHCGAPGAACRRCGAPWGGHYPPKVSAE